MSTSNIVVEAKKRSTSSLNFLRQSGKIPAVVYGHGAGKSEIQLELDAVSFGKLADTLDYSSLIEVKVDKKKIPVLVKEIQRSALKNKILSVDFFAPKMSDSVRANVEIEFVGESPVEKDLGGIVMIALHEVEVEAKPKDLPEKLQVDLSTLATLEDVIRISDLDISKDVTIHRDADDVIVSATHKRVEETEETTEAQDPADVEVAARTDSEESTT